MMPESALPAPVMIVARLVIVPGFEKYEMPALVIPEALARIARRMDRVAISAVTDRVPTRKAWERALDNRDPVAARVQSVETLVRVLAAEGGKVRVDALLERCAVVFGSGVPVA